MMDFDDLEEQETAAMTFYAVSDVHLEAEANFSWLQNLQGDREGTIIVAGDLAVSMSDLETALMAFQRKYKHVFYCFGNHEMWCMRIHGDAHADSWEKLKSIRLLCKDLGVHTTAKLIDGVWVVPIFGWYHSSWDTEPPLQAPTGMKLAREPEPPQRIATDYHACKWGDLANGSEELAEQLDALNERRKGDDEWGAWPLPTELLEDVAVSPSERVHPIISFSHFLPRIELLPEKRFLFQPNLSKVVGSSWIRARLESLKPDIHVFGHTHFPYDMELEGVRYRSWPLGKPDEQSIRITHWPTETAECWPPLPILDTNRRHNEPLVEWTSFSELCWMSNQYRRRKRDACSGDWSSYTANIYCPCAPLIDQDIFCLNNRHAPKECSIFERERRDKYDKKAADYAKRSVQKWMTD